MASTVVRETLATRSLSARYNLFVGLGAVLTVVGLILLVILSCRAIRPIGPGISST